MVRVLVLGFNLIILVLHLLHMARVVSFCRKKEDVAFSVSTHQMFN